MTIGIIATLKVKPGKETEFEAVFRDLQGIVATNEPGCPPISGICDCRLKRVPMCRSYWR